VRLVEPPAQPSNFAATVGDASVTLSWNDPGDESIAGYELFRHGQEQMLVASERAASDEFGYVVAVDGDTLVVGAYRVDESQGAACVFSRQSDGAWNQVAKLTASERSDGDQFGQSVSIDGDVIVVGAVGDDDVADEAGAAYVFEQPTAGWSDMNESRKLTATDGGANDWFGWAVDAVDIDNDTMVVAAHQDDGYDDVLMKNVPNAGAAYVFAKPVGGAWVDATRVAKLTSSKPKEDDQLGTSVAVSGDVVVAGAPVGGTVSPSDYGAALVFVKPQTGWANGTENGVLTASDPTGADRFGVSVDIDTDTIAVGAFRHTAAASDSGAGYVFVKPDSGWTTVTESAKLTASDAAGKDGLGSSIAIHGESILIGAFENHTSGQGAGKAYIYTASAGGWTHAAEMAKLTAMVRAGGDNFGGSVALDGSTILVGAYGVDHEDGNTSDTGAVYVFDYEPSSEIVGSDAGTISHTVSGLVNYRTYSIAVRARNEAGPGPGVVVTATPGFLPAKPSGLIAYPDDDQVTLVWENPQDATIQRYDYKANELVAEGLPGDWTVLDNSNASTTEHIVAGLNHNSKYAFQVRATNIVGTGPESDPVTIIVANRRPVFDVGTSINLQIPENASPGTPVGDPILAIDPDNDSIQHAFGGAAEDVGVFSFNIDTGQISVDRSLDYETKSVYSYWVEATDEHNLNARVTVTINVLDVDETPAGGSSEPTPEPTPTPTPTPVPPPTAQEILDLYAADPEQAAQALQELAETNLELAAQILLDLARQDPSAAQGIVLLLTSSDQGNAAFQQLLLSNPGQAAELLLLTSEEDPELAGELVGELAEENPEQAGQVIARSAQQDEEGTGQLICNAVGGHSQGTGRAVGHSAGEDAGATGRALSTISGNSECVDQLGSTIPVQPWMPEQTPLEGADQTGRGEWQDVGSPAPIENVMARSASNIPGAKANITNLEDQPVGTSPLPSDSVPYAFVDIGHENFDNEDVVTAHATISVEKEWLTANQIHEWSVQLSRFDEPTSSWIPTQSKRIQEDDEKVYYSVTVPGFSLWAIHGNTEAPGLTFVEDNLRMSSSTAAPGDATIVSVDVTNTTTETANYFANLWVDQQIDQTDQILIGPGETETINFTLVIVNAGTYQIRVGSQIGQQPITVEGPVVPPTPVLVGSQVTAAPTPTAIEPLPTVEPTAAPTPGANAGAEPRTRSRADAGTRGGSRRPNADRRTRFGSCCGTGPDRGYRIQ
jgi:PGF-pre-PGF domain-containing protein